MSTKLYSLEQNESYAQIEWKEPNLDQSNHEELENVVRALFKKDYHNLVFNMSKVEQLDGYGVSSIRKATKICTNESGLFVVVSKKDPIVERLDAANIEGLTIMNTVQEGVDAIYLNDLENDYGTDEEDDSMEGGEEFQSDYGDDY